MLKSERPDRPYWQVPVSIPTMACLDGCEIKMRTEDEYRDHMRAHPEHRVGRQRG